ncbi:MAG: hypothetical protein U0Q19_15565 [Kineosporiaceae bacterium]
MNPTTAGVGLATVIAGPTLYGMVQQGQLDSTAALERGAVVAVACVLGLRWIKKIADGYAVEQERARRRAAAEARQAADDARLAATVAQMMADGETPRPPEGDKPD